MESSITKLLLGDTAVALLKAGVETDKKDSDGFLAIELAPDSQVNHSTNRDEINTNSFQVRKFILQSAEREGIEL
jgi:26S proteasome non-ATPase regulatory subunit 10